MKIKNFSIIIFWMIQIILLPTKSNANQNIDEKHIKVAMRMIGDQVLLSTGDSISRVLEIEKINDRYKIEFESEFKFNPESMINIIHQIVIKTKIANQYLVEVEKCDSNKVIYNYEKGLLDEEGLVPCRTRPQPKGCYKLFFTIINPISIVKTTSSKKENSSDNTYYLIGLGLILIGFILFYFKNKTKIKTNTITLGKYQFDRKGMLLTLKSEITDLSSKEVDLLFLLYSNENKTLEREHILNIVWGDEGDYVGRTLDVFISKLRKKLDSDSNIKIINIRGVGYRFVIN